MLRLGYGPCLVGAGSEHTQKHHSKRTDRNILAESKPWVEWG
jgi:hypothetical protein